MEHNRIIHTDRAAASEVIGLSDYRIHNSCDSIDSQGGESLAVQQQSSPSPGIGNSVNLVWDSLFSGTPSKCCFCLFI